MDIGWKSVSISTSEIVYDAAVNDEGHASETSETATYNDQTLSRHLKTK